MTTCAIEPKTVLTVDHDEHIYASVGFFLVMKEDLIAPTVEKAMYSSDRGMTRTRWSLFHWVQLENGQIKVVARD